MPVGRFVTAVSDRFKHHIRADIEIRQLGLALGRSGMALAQLGVFLANPVDVLFPQHFGSDLMLCGGVRDISLWCASTSLGLPPAFAKCISIAVLALVAVGFQPRLTVIPHAYIAFSFAASTPVDNGGDNVAQIVAILLIPIFLGDDRTWHWTRPRALMRGQWRGGALAALLGIRVQASVIYLSAGISKLFSSEWLAGDAVGLVSRHPMFGLPPQWFTVVESFPWWRPVTMLMTWGAMAAELVLCILVLLDGRARMWTWIIGVGLHVMILMMMGLLSFELIMISLVLIVSVRAIPSLRSLPSPGYDPVPLSL